MKKLFLMLGIIGLFLVGCSDSDEVLVPNSTAPTEETDSTIPTETEDNPVIPNETDNSTKPTDSKPEPSESKPVETPTETEVELPWV